MDLVTTAPGVLYRVTTTDGVVQEIDSPAKLPDTGRIDEVRGAGHHGDDPDAVGARRRHPRALPGEARRPEGHRVPRRPDRVLITYELPFNEVVLDFYDRLKTISRGYASLDYHVTGYWESPLVKLDILVNGEPVDALSIDRARGHGLRARPRAGVEDARADPAADVRGRDPGRDRQPHHRPRDRSRRCARTSSPSATAATSRASASCSRSRRKARSA